MYSVGTSTAWASSSGERFISRRRRRSSSPTVTGSLDRGDDVMNKASWQLGGTELTGVIGRGGAQLCGPCRLAAHSYQSNQEDSELRGGETGGGVVSRPRCPEYRVVATLRRPIVASLSTGEELFERPLRGSSVPRSLSTVGETARKVGTEPHELAAGYMTDSSGDSNEETVAAKAASPS